jgi:hypothetical protein
MMPVPISRPPSETLGNKPASECCANGYARTVLAYARRTNLAGIVSVCGRSGVRSTRDSNSAYRPIRSVTLRK